MDVEQQKAKEQMYRAINNAIAELETISQKHQPYAVDKVRRHFAKKDVEEVP